MDTEALELGHAGLVALVRPFTKSSDARIESMISAIEHVDRERVRGDVVECGVWHGGNIMLARKLSPRRTCWLYDTFSGMPKPGPHDKKRSGKPAILSYDRKTASGQKWACVSRAEVIENLQRAGCWDSDRVVLVEGMVEDTLCDPRNVPRSISILRLDTDFYESTKKELEVMYPRLSSGGVLIVDDFGHWLGARKAVTDYFGSQPAVKFVKVDYTAVMAIKPAL